MRQAQRERLGELLGHRQRLTERRLMCTSPQGSEFTHRHGAARRAQPDPD